MTFWGWCHEHYICATLIMFVVLLLIDAIQINYFKTKQ